MQTKQARTENWTETEAGYTLLEVLIAISIFMVGILAIGSMQAAALRSNATSMGVTEAVNVGQGTVERLLATSFDPASPDPVLDPANNGTAAHQDSYTSALGEQYNVAWTTSYLDLNADGNNDALNINVNVVWGDLYGNRSVNFNFKKTTRF